MSYFDGCLQKDHSAMILILEPNTSIDSAEYKLLMARVRELPNVEYRLHREVGAEVTLTEVHLIGNTGTLPIDEMQALPCVEKVVRISEAYRVLGRHKTK